MKTKWMKIAGTSMALGLALTLSPKATGAEGDGNLLELNVNVLSNDDEADDVLDVKVEDAPILGTVSAEVPSENDNGGAVLNVTVEDSAVGNIGANVLYKESSEEAAGSSEKSGVAGVTLEETPVGDAEANVLYEETSEDAAGSAEKSGAAGVTLEETPVGDAEADVLYEEASEGSGGSSEKSGVAGVTLEETPVGDAEADVLYEETSEGAADSSEKSGVAGVTLEETPVGDAEANVLYEEASEGAADDSDQTGVVNVTLEPSPEDGIPAGSANEHPDSNASGPAEGSAAQAESAEQTAEPHDDGGLGLNLNNLPLLGDLHIGLGEQQSDGETDSGSLINVGLTGGILDEVNVDVLGQSSSADGMEQGSLASVGLDNGLTNDVAVNVLGGKQTETTLDGGVVEVNASDLPILEETHVGVIDRHEATDGENAAVTGGVVSAGLSNDLLDDVSATVLGGNAVDTEKGSITNGGVVEVNASDLPILEETHVGVIDRHEATDGENAAVSGGAVSADLSNDLLDDMTANVLGGNAVGTENGSAANGGVVDVNASDLPILEDTHVGVIDRHEATDGENAAVTGGVVSAGLSNDLLDDVTATVLGGNAVDTEDGTFGDSGIVEVIGSGLPLLGGSHLGVLDSHSSTNDEETTDSSGLLQGDFSDGLLGNVGLDVLAKDEMETADGTTIIERGISVQLPDLPLLPIDLNVLVNEQFIPAAPGEGTDPDEGATDPGNGTTDPDEGATDPGNGTTDPDEGVTDPGNGTTDPDAGTTDPNEGTTDPDAGTTEPGEGTTDPDAGTTDPDAGTTDPGEGTTDPDAGTTDPGNGTTDPDAGTTDPGEGTTDPDAGTTDPGEGTTDPDAGTTDPGSGTTDPDAGTTDPDEGATDPGNGTTVPGNNGSNPAGEVEGEEFDQVGTSGSGGSNNTDGNTAWPVGMNDSDDDGSATSSASAASTGEMLPKTGGFLNSLMLVLIALALIGGGAGLRKFA
ncbi:hypothetical protein [Edaphobacillus lindanitolerans]|uniref:LPXTG-motif cell wall anchor domain-containing protein n=1 Tax=Edaphobacillus lindanitolerans TaxID=550447 RepID=A0A1U7PR91_9BACI|nr:hypothetical protein [Edaphobacillus lindanitolerans]SIT87165.1 hypothetical protein SAMN05428946_1970 [Edaphobacillus lindanitolerans]